MLVWQWALTMSDQSHVEFSTDAGQSEAAGRS
jgi:hypothetical protein